MSLIRADARSLPLVDECVDCVVTSPPYWALRDYGSEGQIGLEPSPEDYVDQVVAVFREVRRVLKPAGTVWVNLGDTYAQSGGPGWQGKNGQRSDRRFTCVRDTVPMRAATRRPPGGMKPKDLVGIPWMVAFALRADGWYLRSDVVWSKPNPLPESVFDRPTKAHEYVFLLTKSSRYFYDKSAICEPYHPDTVKRGRSIRQVAADGSKVYRFNGEPLDEASIARGRNARSVWHIPTSPFRGAHFATMPEKLVEPCVLAGCPTGGLVLDPFVGSGTVIVVSRRLGRRAVGVDLGYQDVARRRTGQAVLVEAPAPVTFPADAF